MYKENQKNNEEKFKITSLFSGCGGLDLGFEKAGFKVAWANEFDKTIWDTFSFNFSNTKLDKRSIIDIPSSEIPREILAGISTERSKLV